MDLEKTLKQAAAQAFKEGRDEVQLILASLATYLRVDEPRSEADQTALEDAATDLVNAADDLAAKMNALANADDFGIE